MSSLNKLLRGLLTLEIINLRTMIIGRRNTSKRGPTVTMAEIQDMQLKATRYFHLQNTNFEAFAIYL